MSQPENKKRKRQQRRETRKHWHEREELSVLCYIRDCKEKGYEFEVTK